MEGERVRRQVRVQGCGGYSDAIKLRGSESCVSEAACSRDESYISTAPLRYRLRSWAAHFGESLLPVC